MFLDATYGQLFHLILLIPSRWIASRLAGSTMPPLRDEKRLSEQEEQTNDPSIAWPSSDAIKNLPQDWIVQEGNGGNETGVSEVLDAAGSSTSRTHSSSKKRRSAKINNKPSSIKHKDNTNALHSNKPNGEPTVKIKQPYYLNHVRGSTRIRHVSQRIGAAMGTLFSSYVLCSISSLVTFDDVGLGSSSLKRAPFDVLCGLVVGSSIVVFIFLLELKMGWIKIVGTFETVVLEEIFALNFAWDILFHVGVSINEELMLRGWMFILGCHGLLTTALDWFEQPSNAAIFAIAMSIVLQSTLFAFLHLYSPGSTVVSLLNLFFGGIAAACNVMVAGGTLWLGIGWHFGWNITMGHILGRSTSGIPMSCAVVSVVPRPDSSYEKYHGGTFGPEQGVLAPLAYILGMLMVIAVYGWDDLEMWREQLVTNLAESQS